MQENKRKNTWAWVVLVALVIILALWYFLRFVDNSKVSTTDPTVTTTASTTIVSPTTQYDANTNANTAVQMNDAQKTALVSAGIDVNSIPTTLSATEQACVLGKLGYTRSMELVRGAVPTATEIDTIKTCLN